MKRISINGFGRIGRLAFRQLIKNDSVQVCAINDLTDAATLAHLFKYDSTHGKYDGTVEVKENMLVVDGKSVEILSERDPEKLPWDKMNIDMVLECTGRFVSEEGASKHLTAGAKKVQISAPAKGNIPTVVMGVNDEVITDDVKIFSNASCTTNCLAPMAKVLNDNIGIVKGHITTVHAYTMDQNLQDSPHSDLRRARAGAYSIIPTTTGAAKAVGKVIPELSGKLDGNAVRVPIPDGSLTDFTVVLKRDSSIEEINSLMQKASNGLFQGIVEYTDEPIVSIDIVGNPHSCIFDSQLTMVNGDLVKIVGWYDNETGYASRLVDMTLRHA
jgi:glyceraldehyde 3-phosphate dehydrogenase|tara:strand:+ start:1601 stop:2587 length:987 start_codon:yes stop_codon:yes gene_type:complete